MIEGVRTTPAVDSSSADVKIWAQKHWGLPQETKLLVREVRMDERNVPAVVTVIAVLSLAVVDKTIKIEKRIRDIRESDIQAVDIWN
ncbi:hypothetical protein SAMN02745866_00626 [Alteromonadaceae bacterium Bs31]|nr:hypothetical protein SAMN02745866_00626 [Alteromonadaceae bacterium Bs31]